MTFKELTEKVDRLQNLLLDNESSPELICSVVSQLSEIRMYLSNPEYIEDIEELKRELIQTC